MTDISPEKAKEVQENLCTLLQEENRILGGGFLYTSDIMYNPNIVKGMAQIFAKKFRNAGADYVATIETKGIPVAFMTAQLLNIPVIVIRRETKISEGSHRQHQLLPGIVRASSEDVYFQACGSAPAPKCSLSMTSCGAAAASRGWWKSSPKWTSHRRHRRCYRQH